MPAPSLVAVASAPSEGLRLLEEAARAAGSAPEPERVWLEESYAGRAALLRTGELEGALLIGPKDEGVALAWWDTRPALPRRLGWCFGEGFATRAVARTFLEALSREAPILGVWDPAERAYPDGVREALASRGLERTLRKDLVYPLDVPLPGTDPAAAPGSLRPLGPADAPALVRLLGRAYRTNAVDRALFVVDIDPVAEARRSVDHLLYGGVGTWRPSASFGVEVEAGRLAAATLVNEFHGPLIAEVVTDPKHRRQGLARRVLLESLAALRRAGAARPRLVVTEGNDGAERLYRSVGFVDDLSAVGGIWLDPDAVASIPAYPDEA